MSRQKRALSRDEQAMRETIEYLLKLPEAERVKMEGAQEYQFTMKQPAPMFNAGRTDEQGSITMTLNMGTVQSAALLRGQNLKPAVLNFAHGYNCGGGFEHAAGSQEEDIFRNSSAFLSLWPHRRKDDGPGVLARGMWIGDFDAALPRKNAFYPHTECGGIYSPHVRLVRDSSKQGSPLWPAAMSEEAPVVSVLTVAAQNVGREGKFQQPLLREKLRTALYIAREHGHDAVVLGAFGCGYFRNPPSVVASTFKELLLTEFASSFRVVAFGVIGAHNLPHFEEHFPRGTAKDLAARLQMSEAKPGLETPVVTLETRGLLLGDEGLSESEQKRTRIDFFASGVESWQSVLGNLTFPSVSIPLARKTATALAAAASGFDDDGDLANDIDAILAEQGWSKVFVKLSTRSPKDAPQILQRASAVFAERGGPTLLANDRCKLFSELVQQNFCVTSGVEAVELLGASERVREDCLYAIDGDDYEHLGVHVVLRRWDGAIPPSSEFRGICWNAKMNAVSQYYHPLHFPELEALREMIAQDLQAVYAEIQPKLCAAGFSNCIIDFAWLAPQDVRVIEINPFDGVGLGTMAASTCLFRWDAPPDRKVIMEGPFELRLRSSAQSEYDLKRNMNAEWREIVFPPQWKVSGGARDAYGQGEKKPLPKACLPPPGKGKGKGSNGKGKSVPVP